MAEEDNVTRTLKAIMAQDNDTKDAVKKTPVAAKTSDGEPAGKQVATGNKKGVETKSQEHIDVEDKIDSVAPVSPLTKNQLMLKLDPLLDRFNRFRQRVAYALTKKPQRKQHDDMDKSVIKAFNHAAKKQKKEKRTAAGRRRWFKEHLEKAGFSLLPAQVDRLIFRISVGITILLSIFLIILSIKNLQQILGIIIQLFALWTVGFTVTVIVMHIAFRIFVDIRVFQRRLSVEEVLPDFLQLTSANIRAGMPIDRALWLAVRPRFGILAKEIEDVAKSTLSGENLHKALLAFANKYDSAILVRSVHLLNEGIEAGGDVGDLLNKIANNIQELRAMKKEMAAHVTTYVIFISFAAVIAAPFLFGLSNQLLQIVQGIAGSVTAGSTGSTSGMGISMNLSSDNISLSDYQVFAYSCLGISAFFSAVIVSTITKGNIKEGAHYIPMFIIVSVLFYLMATKILGGLLGGLI